MTLMECHHLNLMEQPEATLTMLISIKYGNATTSLDRSNFLKIALENG